MVSTFSLIVLYTIPYYFNRFKKNAKEKKKDKENFLMDIQFLQFKQDMHYATTEMDNNEDHHNLSFYY